MSDQNRIRTLSPREKERLQRLLDEPANALGEPVNVLVLLHGEGEHRQISFYAEGRRAEVRIPYPSDSGAVAWDRVLKLARGIWGLANDGLDGPADPEVVKEDAASIASIAEEHGGQVDREKPHQAPRPRPFPGQA